MRIKITHNFGIYIKHCQLLFAFSPGILYCVNVTQYWDCILWRFGILISFFFFFFKVFYFLNFKIFNSYMHSQTWTPPPTSLPITSFWVIPMHQPQACCWSENSYAVQCRGAKLESQVLVSILYSNHQI